MNILIYGAGAVGLGLASCLLQSGEKVCLLGREETVDALRTHGLRRTGIFGEVAIPAERFQAVTALSDVPEDNYDYILVCTKTFDTRPAAEDLGTCDWIVQRPIPFVLCQNGWGNADIFAQVFPTERIRVARIITGFRRPAPHHVDITVHAESIHLGNLYHPDVSDLQPLADAIARGGIPCETTDTIGKDLWAKLLYNCMLNALSTIFAVPYGRLGDSKHTRELMDNVAREVFDVMAADGHSTHWDRAEAYLETFYKHQLPATYNHESSMLQDIRAGKRTEIDALNGAVTMLGRKHGIRVPLNNALTHMIKFLESSFKPA